MPGYLCHSVIVFFHARLFVPLRHRVSTFSGYLCHSVTVSTLPGYLCHSVTVSTFSGYLCHSVTVSDGCRDAIRKCTVSYLINFVLSAIAFSNRHRLTRLYRHFFPIHRRRLVLPITTFLHRQRRLVVTAKTTKTNSRIYFNRGDKCRERD